MNPKKKSRRCRASVSIQALNLVISRFIHSLVYYIGNLVDSPTLEFFDYEYLHELESKIATARKVV
jgi:hypothetical protein